MFAARATAVGWSVPAPPRLETVARLGAVTSVMGVMPPQHPLPASGALGDAEVKQKRARTSRPKVKTGCNNCK